MKTITIKTFRNDTPYIHVLEGIRAAEKAGNEMTDALLDFLEVCREEDTTTEINPLPNGFEFRSTLTRGLSGSCRYILSGTRKNSAFVIWAIDGIIQYVDFFKTINDATDKAKTRYRGLIEEGWRSLERMSRIKSRGDNMEGFEYAAISKHTCTLWTAHIFWF